MAARDQCLPAALRPGTPLAPDSADEKVEERKEPSKEAERRALGLVIRHNQHKRALSALQGAYEELADEKVTEKYAKCVKTRKMELSLVRTHDQATESETRSLYTAVSMIGHVWEHLNVMLRETKKLVEIHTCRCPPRTQQCCGHCQLNCACWLRYEGEDPSSSSEAEENDCDECRAMVKRTDHACCGEL